MTVLLIDDEPVILKSVGDFLKRSGYQVHTFPSGAEALQFLAGNDADAVISDIRMPGMSGFDLLSAIRMRHAHIPVVLITGHGDMDTAIEALKRGAFDYLSKPLKLGELMEILNCIANHSRVERDAREIWMRLTRVQGVGANADALELRGYLESIRTNWTHLAPVLKAISEAPADRPENLARCVLNIERLLDLALEKAVGLPVQKENFT